MFQKKSVTILTFSILLLSILSCCISIFQTNMIHLNHTTTITTFRNETVQLVTSGIYKNNSVSAVLQAIAQDYVTLFVAVPLLVGSYIFTIKNSLRARLMLTGTIGYFLYTYTSYTFLLVFNPLFLVYVCLMSISFFCFILLISSFNRTALKHSFHDSFPFRFFAGFQITFGILLALMWLKRILPAILFDSAPYGIEHYTTLVIQGLDLGFIVPVSILSGILLFKKNEWGYLLSCIVITKGTTLSIAILCMLIFQALGGEKLPLESFIFFPVLCITLILCLILLLKNIKKD